MSKAEATASYQGAVFVATGEGDTLEEAQKAAIVAIDKKIDGSFGLAKNGNNGYDLNRIFKDSVTTIPPILPTSKE